MEAYGRFRGGFKSASSKIGWTEVLVDDYDIAHGPNHSLQL